MEGSVPAVLFAQKNSSFPLKPARDLGKLEASELRKGLSPGSVFYTWIKGNPFRARCLVTKMD
jgi:hypothetical protein